MAKTTKKTWQELPVGCILEPGSALNFKTGNWRNKRPLCDKDKCTNCLLCWINCPEGAIKVKDGKIVSIDLDYCKGCGICAQVCPAKAIVMKNEKDFKRKNKPTA